MKNKEREALGGHGPEPSGAGLRRDPAGSPVRPSTAGVRLGRSGNRACRADACHTEEERTKPGTAARREACLHGNSGSEHSCFLARTWRAPQEPVLSQRLSVARKYVRQSPLVACVGNRRQQKALLPSPPWPPARAQGRAAVPGASPRTACPRSRLQDLLCRQASQPSEDSREVSGETLPQHPTKEV